MLYKEGKAYITVGQVDRLAIIFGSIGVYVSTQDILRKDYGDNPCK